MNQPDNQSKKPCRYFQRGNCRHGEQCKFSHGQQQQNRDRNHGRNFRRKKNTESFEPSHEPMDMRLMVGDGTSDTYGQEIRGRDVVLVSGIFNKENDLSIYKKLLEEIKDSGIDNNEIWKLWHGDTHFIADDKKGWKEHCPTFLEVVEGLAKYFKMDVKATRLNWYHDLSEWKPYHHDAAAIKSDKARTQNFTVGISFGAKRIAGFEHAKTRTKVSVPLQNGMTYAFSRDVNVEWRHGIPQMDSYETEGEAGRISIILWGYVDLKE